MKKVFALLSVAFGMFALSSCVNHEVEIQMPQEGINAFSFVANLAKTKTTLDGMKVDWEDGDIIYAKSEVGEGARIKFTYDAGTGMFTTDSLFADGSYTFDMIYADAGSFPYKDDVKVHALKKSQVQDGENPTAHIKANDALVGRVSVTFPITEVASVDMSHIYTMMQVNVKNESSSAISLAGLELTADAYLGGAWTIDYENIPATSLKEGSAYNQKSISVVLDQEVAAGQTAPVYFIMAPLSNYTGEVKMVVTDSANNSYTKTMNASGLTFEAGKYNTTTIAISEPDAGTGSEYIKVTSVPANWAGRYLIVREQNETTGLVFNGEDATSDYVTATIADGKIMGTPAIDAVNVEIAPMEGGYSIKAVNGFMYGQKGSNGLKFSNTPQLNTIAMTDSCAVITSNSTTLQFNQTSGQERFRYYKSINQRCVQLYRLKDEGNVPPVKATPSMKVKATDVILTVGGDSVDIEAETNSDGQISFSSSNPSVAVVDEDGIVEAVAPGTCKVTFSVAETDNFNAASLEVNVTVKEAGAVVTLSQILDAANGKLDNNSGSGDIDTFDIGECTVVALSGNNYVVKDDTAVMLMFKLNAGLALGDVITMSGKVTNYWGIAEINNPTITKVSSGATVNHGTATSLDEDGIAAYLAETNFPVVKYYKVKGTLGTDGKTLTVGSQTVTLYNALSDNAGKTVTVYGYSIGKSSADKTTGKRKINFVNTSVEVSATDPSLSVDAASKTWAYDATDAFVAHVTATAGTWSVSPATLDWATVAVDAAAGTITVTPKGQNTSAADYEATLTVSHSAVATLTRTITLKQTKKPAEGAASYVLTSADIIAAHSAAWTYSSGMKSITAADGSQWSANNTFSNKNQATIQMNKGKTSYVLTPVVPSGKSISRLVVTCTTDNAGTKPTGVTRTFDITDASTGAAIATDIMGDDLTAGIDVSGSHTQLKIAPNETNGGACYIANITVQYN